MGNAISFRLNPKSEKDKQILSWLEEKSLQPGFLNQTEVIKKAILTAIEDEQKENREKSIEDWISEAILLSREEFIKIVQESSQNVANNMFAGGSWSYDTADECRNCSDDAYAYDRNSSEQYVREYAKHDI